jgi:hypothetical protein
MGFMTDILNHVETLKLAIAQVACPDLRAEASKALNALLGNDGATPQLTVPFTVVFGESSGSDVFPRGSEAVPAADSAVSV